MWRKVLKQKGVKTNVKFMQRMVNRSPVWKNSIEEKPAGTLKIKREKWGLKEFSSSSLIANSMVKSAYCSYKGPGLGAQYPCGSSQPSICNSSSKISRTLFWPLQDIASIHMHIKLIVKLMWKVWDTQIFYCLSFPHFLPCLPIPTPPTPFLETESFSVAQVSLELTF